MFGYDGWKLASPYDDEQEWTETVSPTCEAELVYTPAAHVCNDNCDPGEDAHVCGWNEEIEVTCVGSGDNYTRYWTCNDCGTENEDRVSE